MKSLIIQINLISLNIVEFDNISKNYQFLTDKNLNYEKEIEQLLFQQKILKEKLIKIRDQKKVLL